MKRAKFSEKHLRIVEAIPQAARKSKFWKRVIELLSSPARNKKGVNISKIAKYAKEKQVVVVPDKVLGAGTLSSKLTVAAVSFSAAARKAIQDAGGKIVSIAEAAAKNPSGKDHIIIK
ncbi:MAG: 50S ribosomal protein L18e [Candidatus Micrarchaeota archaeon]|nr:50S ribosomal protein L18e [Candidatus Micrarchaeota archaeon]